MRAVITVIGTDRVGIIAGVSNVLADNNVNILDISQTTLQELFTMIMLVDVSKCRIDFNKLSVLLDEKGIELEMSVRIQHEDLFKSMHRL